MFSFKFNFTDEDEDFDTNQRVDNAKPDDTFHDEAFTNSNCNKDLSESSEGKKDSKNVLKHQLSISFWLKNIANISSNCGRVNLPRELLNNDNIPMECLKFCLPSSTRGLPLELKDPDATPTNSSTLQEKLLQDNTDLQKGSYEGGFKIWECTYDLIHYFKRLSEFTGKRVLDLGCGSGLLGILSVIGRASCTYFQDYNREVIDNFAIPNLLLNVSGASDSEEILNETRSDALYGLEDKVSFLSGDWQLVEEYFLENKLTFDIVMSSETIYDSENYHKLYSLLKQCLAKDGRALFAAKSYYFGVGGSTTQFKHYLEKGGEFQCSTVWETSQGVSREIFQVVLR